MKNFLPLINRKDNIVKIIYCCLEILLVAVEKVSLEQLHFFACFSVPVHLFTAACSIAADQNTSHS